MITPLPLTAEQCEIYLEATAAAERHSKAFCDASEKVQKAKQECEVAYAAHCASQSRLNKTLKSLGLIP